LVALEFDRGHLPFAKDKSIEWEPSDKKTRPYARELAEYFAGKRRQFSFPLDLRGTPFQLSCWRALLKIPYGETRTYADIARAVGQPQAFRAVGMANNRNPIAIVVPCHRVIASDGTLCGYGGGLDIKRKLLELEGALTGFLAA
jgi:methylated-DNA-[protein]-cysteine S-methyltransferase